MSWNETSSIQVVLLMRGFDHRRIREKYEAELREVERSERNTLEKFNSMKVCTLNTCIV